jgi:hypothetical protein
MSEKEVDVIEVLEPSDKFNVVTLNEGTPFVRTYEQKPLSFFGKIELFSVLADAIEKAMSEGATIGELLEELPSNTADISAAEVAETDVLVRAIAKIVKFAPDILEDVFCISLGVKRNERDMAKEGLRELDDEEAMKILNTFIDQNWEAMMDFFGKQVMPLIQNVSGKLQSRSTSSTPSKASRQRTPKQ